MLTMDRMNFDFYIWSTDRFVRAMTATFDVSVPLNLEVTPAGLQPVIENLGVDTPFFEFATHNQFGMYPEYGLDSRVREDRGSRLVENQRGVGQILENAFDPVLLECGDLRRGHDLRLVLLEEFDAFFRERHEAVEAANELAHLSARFDLCTSSNKVLAAMLRCLKRSKKTASDTRK